MTLCDFRVEELVLAVMAAAILVFTLAGIAISERGRRG